MEKTKKEQPKIDPSTSNPCTECESVRLENQDLSQRVSQLEGRLQCVEDEGRLKNLLFYGIPQRSSALEYRQDVLEVIHGVLGLQQDVAVEHVYRSGTAVIVRFVSRTDRDSILSNVRRLQGTQFSVREDVSPTVRQKQKGLLPWYKDLRRQKKKANIVQDRLITSEGVFTFDLNTKTVIRVEENGGKSRRTLCFKSKQQPQDSEMTSCKVAATSHWPQSDNRAHDGNCNSSANERIHQQSNYPSFPEKSPSGCDTIGSNTTETESDVTRVFSPLSTSDTIDMFADMSMDSGFSTMTASLTSQSSHLFTSQSRAGQDGKISAEGSALSDKQTTTKQPRFSTPVPTENAQTRFKFPSAPLDSAPEGNDKKDRVCKNCGYQEQDTESCTMNDSFDNSVADRNRSTHTENICINRPYMNEIHTQTDETDDVFIDQDNTRFEKEQTQATTELNSSATQTDEDCNSHVQSNVRSERANSNGTSIPSRSHMDTEHGPKHKHVDGKKSMDHRSHEKVSDMAAEKKTSGTLPKNEGHRLRPVDKKTTSPRSSNGVQCSSPRSDKVPAALKLQGIPLTGLYDDSARNSDGICSPRNRRCLQGLQQGNVGSNPAKIPSTDSSASSKLRNKSSKQNGSFREAERDVGWHRSGGQWQYSHKRATGDTAQHPANREALKANLECVVPPSPVSPTSPAPLVNGSGEELPPPPSFLMGGGGDDGGSQEEGGGDGGGGGAGGRRRTLQEQDHISLKLSEMKDSILQPIKEDLSEWITRIIGVQISPDTFLEVLDSGVALCTISKLIEKHAQDYAKQGKLNEPLPSFKLRCNAKAKSGTWFSRDNVTNFLGWCRAYGMTDETMFDSEDLVCHKQEKPVINCVLELARIGWRYGIEPPNLIRMEREIEKQAQEFEPPPYVPPPPPSPPPPPPSPVVEKPVEPPVEVKKPEKIELHKEVKRLAHKCKCQEYVNRISEGVYDVFGKRVFIRLLHGQHLMVRVGGGWDTFENYLLHHDPIQVYEFRRPASRETLQADFDGYLVIRSKYKS